MSDIRELLVLIFLCGLQQFHHEHLTDAATVPNPMVRCYEGMLICPTTGECVLDNESCPTAQPKTTESYDTTESDTTTILPLVNRSLYTISSTPLDSTSELNISQPDTVTNGGPGNGEENGTTESDLKTESISQNVVSSVQSVEISTDDSTVDGTTDASVSLTTTDIVDKDKSLDALLATIDYVNISTTHIVPTISKSTATASAPKPTKFTKRIPVASTEGLATSPKATTSRSMISSIINTTESTSHHVQNVTQATKPDTSSMTSFITTTYTTSSLTLSSTTVPRLSSRVTSSALSTTMRTSENIDDHGIESHTTQQISNLLILVFKGHLANKYHFKSTLTNVLSRKMNDMSDSKNNSEGSSNHTFYILNIEEFGPKNTTVTSKLSAVEYFYDSNSNKVSRLVPASEVLSKLKIHSTDDWADFKIDDVEFVCGYSSKDKPCSVLPLPDKTVILGGLFEDNKYLFIAIFALSSLCFAIVVFGLIYLRCRQRRCSSYVTNVTLEKARLTYLDTDVNQEIHNSLTDKEILKGEVETSQSQNGAPPAEKEEGWIIPLDHILDERRNSLTEDTKL